MLRGYQKVGTPTPHTSETIIGPLAPAQVQGPTPSPRALAERVRSTRPIPNAEDIHSFGDSGPDQVRSSFQLCFVFRLFCYPITRLFVYCCFFLGGWGGGGGGGRNGSRMLAQGSKAETELFPNPRFRTL